MFLVRCEAAAREDLGRGGVGVLLEEVVLHLPGVVNPELVGQLDLVQRVLEELLLNPLVPRLGQLVLVEDPESHGGSVPICVRQRSRGADCCTLAADPSIRG